MRITCEIILNSNESDQQLCGSLQVTFVNINEASYTTELKQLDTYFIAKEFRNVNNFLPLTFGGDDVNRHY